jgi:hypothetical protein
MPQIGHCKHIVELRAGRCMRYSSGLRNAAPEFGLWIVNLVAVFVTSRYLFGMNSLAIFWGWDPTSLLAFLGERHRFSDILFGVGSDPVLDDGVSLERDPEKEP